MNGFDLIRQDKIRTEYWNSDEKNYTKTCFGSWVQVPTPSALMRNGAYKNPVSSSFSKFVKSTADAPDLHSNSRAKLAMAAPEIKDILDDPLKKMIPVKFFNPQRTSLYLRNFHLDPNSCC